MFKKLIIIVEGNRFYKNIVLCHRTNAVSRPPTTEFVHSRLFVSLIMPPKKAATAKATIEIETDTKQNHVSIELEI